MGAAASTHDGVAERRRIKQLKVLIKQTDSMIDRMWADVFSNLHREGFDEQAWLNSSEHAQLMASVDYVRRLNEEHLALFERLSECVTLLPLLLLAQCQWRSTAFWERLGLPCPFLDCTQQPLATCPALLACSRMLQWSWSSVPGQQCCRHSRTAR
jgi:hypothetical protein